MQVFHYCYEGRYASFFCPNQTLFNQRYLVCDWYSNVDCQGSEQYYAGQKELFLESAARAAAIVGQHRPAGGDGSLVHGGHEHAGGNGAFGGGRGPVASSGFGVHGHAVGGGSGGRGSLGAGGSNSLRGGRVLGFGGGSDLTASAAQVNLNLEMFVVPLAT